MRVVHCKQGTAEWYMARLGKPTASDFDRIITPVNGDPSKSQDKYVLDLLAERVYGCPPEDVETFTSRAMQHGTETEPMARAAYEFETNNTVVEVGFCETDDGAAGCSPDGLIGEDGGLELKCPQLSTHLGYLRDHAKLVQDYRCQVHGCLWVTGRKWWDICSYAPWGGVPMVKVRVEPDEFTEKLAEAVKGFVEKLDAAWAEIEPQLTATAVIDGDHPF